MKQVTLDTLLVSGLTNEFLVDLKECLSDPCNYDIINAKLRITSVTFEKDDLQFLIRSPKELSDFNKKLKIWK